MATLKEIYEKYGVGAIVRHEEDIVHYTIIGKCVANSTLLWLERDAPNQEIKSSLYNLDSCGWKFYDIYKEPNPQVERWLFIYKTRKDIWILMQGYMTEQRAKDVFDEQEVEMKEIKKLEWSRQVFDE